MKIINIASIVVPLLLGAMAWRWTSLDSWYDMKEGLIAFLGFLSAALIQVMTLTANFLQSDKLTPQEAEKLTRSLTNQQRYWMGLLMATIATMFIVIIGSALKSRIENFPIHASELMCFLIASSVAFVFMKMLGMLNGIMSLHRLRGELVVNAAKRAAAEKAEIIQKDLAPKIPIVGESYGKLFSEPHH